MRGNQNHWQRIEAVVKWTNMSVNYFARHIGLPRGENLYQIKRGNNGVSFDVAGRIVEKFPQIDKLWLLTGEGVMFADEKLRGATIPFYNVGVEESIMHIAQLEPNSNLMVPQVGECDLAMCYTGRAMGCAIPAGSIVLLKNIDRDSIIPGEEYVIISRKIVTLRIVRLAEVENKFRLVAADRENYDDIILNISDIKSVYKVRGKLIINR